MSCAGLQVSYAARVEDAPQATADRITILVPGEAGAFQVFHGAVDGLPHSTHVQAPEVCVIPAQRPYRLLGEDSGDLIVITLDAGFFQLKARQSFGGTRHLSECHGVADPFLRGVGNVLAGGFRAAMPPTEAYLESLASSLALHLAANYHAEPSAPPRYSGLAPHKLQRVLASIEERLAEPIQVRELADTIHMSPFHFARMFKQATGKPPHAYITHLRMERARNLLAGSEFSLSEIASRVGYQTQAHFTGVFHRHVGVTPRTYRVSARMQQPVVA